MRGAGWGGPGRGGRYPGGSGRGGPATVRRSLWPGEIPAKWRDMRITTAGTGVALLLAALLVEAGAQPTAPDLFRELHWRNIGPFRGGRTRAAAGVPGQPNVFYMGQVNGGVWKTDDYGQTWVPVFDAQPTQSIGAIAIAPSNPAIIYVASDEGLRRTDLS